MSISKWANGIHQGAAVNTLRDMPESSVHMAMCSPPYYGLRDYGKEDQLGLEDTLAEYIGRLVDVGEEVRRVLRDDGSWWLNLGDSYGGDKQKMLVPHRAAIALQEAGWTVRNDVVWAKPNPMPESVKDRLSTTFEFVFHLVTQGDYWYDLDTIREPHEQDNALTKSRGSITRHGVPGTKAEPRPHPAGKNPGDVFEVTTKPYPAAHFAVYPPELCEKPIKATCPEDGIVLDPFVGSGTTCLVAKRLNRRFIGIDLNPEYVAMAQARIGLTVDNPDILTDQQQSTLGI